MFMKRNQNGFGFVLESILKQEGLGVAWQGSEKAFYLHYVITF